MTLTDTSASTPTRRATERSILMCRPEYFTVNYRINPWMHPEQPTDTSLAVSQWEVLYQTYLDLGFDVQIGGSLYSDALGSPGSGADTYAGMMRANVRTIVAALAP